MVIRNKKIIGLISFLVGLIIFGYMVFKIRVIFYGNKTEAVVTGFVVHQNGARKVLNENGSSKKPFSGRSPFVKFRIKNGSEVETYSKVLQMFFFTGYHLGNKVTVIYNPKNPREIFILNAKEIPGSLLMTAFGILLIVMGKSFIFPKNRVV
ncbi:DUF3592 domain-containing protein [Chryseobacterium joostei]|uniref:DUF3592 domain-containing protein n=2 Tax=Chryseobacterium joostei TaxID=112234 RepID=A0A1N7IBT9_9FLAO|nr:DUF3592 domain-containing protein [Chryseobacterium joostei]AZB01829.1 DUF3592 domain-containing protein [Chryseobacterium joostei]SIS34507.1 Protein of unknown function [Chryseobacterium joostei]